MKAEYGEPEFRSFITSHRWIFAKTMRHNPHEYTLRKETSDDRFEAAVKKYTVCFCDDHNYWTMGAPLEDTILINRKRKGRPKRTNQVESQLGGKQENE